MGKFISITSNKMANLKTIIKTLRDHEKRIRALEDSTPAGRERKATTAMTQKGYSGAIGGVRLLIKNGFFKTRRKQKDIRKELADKNYHYSSQAIYEALKTLSKPNGPLVVLKEKRQKVYVKRK